MTAATDLRARLAIPAIVAPMFLVSGPDLVVACSSSGLLGTFPTLNARTSDDLERWLTEIPAALGDKPFGANLIVHKSNPRLGADLEAIVRHQVPVVITSLGAVPDVVRAVHGYGGIVLHDVINVRHSHKAVEAGVDGLIAVSAGAGGHAGTLNPFALVAEIRGFFDGIVALAGAITDGCQIAAARMLGADFAYIGSHFIPAAESLASDPQKQMMIGATAADIVYSDKVTGVGANFLRESLASATLPEHDGAMTLSEEAKAWKTIWSAGHGVGAVHAVRPAAHICRELIDQYAAATSDFARG